jgi:glycosyltransferase involved in cell wall biosynthesis
MRITFFNEGNLGTQIMGQGQLDMALRVGLAGTPAVQARFAGLTEMGRWAQRLANSPLPLLGRANLDLRTLRWHLVQSRRARSMVLDDLGKWPADVLLVHSQSVALTMASVMRRLPVAVSVDTTVDDWASMPAWRMPQRHAPAMLAPSRALERRALERAALVFAWTGWARAAVQRTAPRARVISHHPGIDLQRYQPAQRRSRTIPRVLFVGGRFAEKGGEDLLAALGGSLARTVELDLVTPASVPPRPGVRLHRLRPGAPELLDLFQQADVLCLPTYGDAAPWAVLEAMACGTPVVASRIGGIPDMLEDGRAGLLINHGNRTQLAQALHGLLDNQELRAALAARARERCERVYDARLQFAAMHERLRGLY